jgi:hypothetical protein
MFHSPRTWAASNVAVSKLVSDDSQGTFVPEWRLVLNVSRMLLHFFLCSELELKKSGAQGRVIYDDAYKYPGKEDVGPFLGAVGGFAGGEAALKQFAGMSSAVMMMMVVMRVA